VVTSSSNSYRPDEELEEQEEEEDGSRDDEGLGFSDSSRKRGLSPDPPKKRTNIEEHWSRYGQFELTSVLQETHEKYFYGSEHWNYFTNDEVNVFVASGLRALSNNL